MARKWELKENVFAWNMERCEEVILVAGYEAIKSFAGSSENWNLDFENHFYHHGNGVAFYFIDHINAVRRKRNLAKLDFMETDVLDYGRSTDKMMKSEFRQRTRDELHAASTDERLSRVRQAEFEAAALRPPHIPYAEWKSQRAATEEANARSRDEVRKRLIVQPQMPPRKPSLPAESAATMLKHSSPKLWPDIINRLSSDVALALVPQMDNGELRDILILHALNA